MVHPFVKALSCPLGFNVVKNGSPEIQGFTLHRILPHHFWGSVSNCLLRMAYISLNKQGIRAKLCHFNMLRAGSIFSSSKDAVWLGKNGVAISKGNQATSGLR